jgi:putative redox protein
MSVDVIRDPSGPLKQTVRVRAHTFTADASIAEGGEDAGPSPHDLYDAALAACKVVTVLWYAQRKGIPVEDVAVSVERDATEERSGVYRLDAHMRLRGALSDAQRRELLSVAEKCPVHKLMTQVRTEIRTTLVE